MLNDGTAAVLFGIVLASVGGESVSASGIAGNFLLTVGGGVLCGAVVGKLALLLAGKTSDHLVEITFTTLAAYGSFLLAEKFHLSGVLACMTAGIMVGNLGAIGAFTDDHHEAVESFWEYVGFAANSLVFILIGTSLAKESFSSAWIACAVVILLVLVARAASIYGCSLLFMRSKYRVSRANQHVLFWGGLRGALGLALALGLPSDFPMRGVILDVTFAVVAFSVIVQGLTISPLLSKLGLIAPKQAAKSST